PAHERALRHSGDLLGVCGIIAFRAGARRLHRSAVHMASRMCSTRDGERGQVLVLTAVALIALCAVVGLAFDVWYLFDDRRRPQTAADAAALAGAREWRKAGSAGVVAAANAGAASNGFTNGQNGTDVVVNIPPTSGYYASNSSFLETIVSRSRPTLFLG